MATTITHRHRALPVAYGRQGDDRNPSGTIATRAWTSCVSARGCSGAAHGGVVFRNECRCGAYRLTESNGVRQNSTGWIDGESE